MFTLACRLMLTILCLLNLSDAVRFGNVYSNTDGAAKYVKEQNSTQVVLARERNKWISRETFSLTLRLENECVICEKERGVSVKLIRDRKDSILLTGKRLMVGDIVVVSSDCSFLDSACRYRNATPESIQDVIRRDPSRRSVYAFVILDEPIQTGKDTKSLQFGKMCGTLNSADIKLLTPTRITGFLINQPSQLINAVLVSAARGLSVQNAPDCRTEYISKDGAQGMSGETNSFFRRANIKSGDILVIVCSDVANYFDNANGPFTLAKLRSKAAEQDDFFVFPIIDV
ncbi:hypothetical protein PSACC_00886 [Paramicrosporidium saccamoebae]|uniref:Uncharacterized protein n=1 Tax=Paramicrosporidium saccamoebae TaxID=1246581 RepID=A0A2H9TNJ7_9FUNG|nr:hypothetical protein PSACC_00886 [Paramicrosporidium saccamoebae]